MNLFPLHLYLIIVILIIFETNKIYCGEFLISENKKYYFEGEQKYNWFEALEECGKRNMFLATIDNKNKDRLHELLKHEERNEFWTGGHVYQTKKGLVGAWMQNGQKVVYLEVPWRYDLPVLFREDHHHCIVNYKSLGMALLNIECHHKRGFLCNEYQLNDKEMQKIRQLDERMQDALQELEFEKYLKEKIKLEIAQQHNLQQELELVNKTIQKNNELIEKLKQQLQLAETIDLKECQNIKTKYDLINQNITKQQIQLKELQQKQKENVQQQQKQCENHNETSENIIDDELQQKREDDDKKYRIINFNFQTYFQGNRQETFKMNQ